MNTWSLYFGFAAGLCSCFTLKTGKWLLLWYMWPDKGKVPNRKRYRYNFFCIFVHKEANVLRRRKRREFPASPPHTLKKRTEVNNTNFRSYKALSLCKMLKVSWHLKSHWAKKRAGSGSGAWSGTSVVQIRGSGPVPNCHGSTLVYRKTQKGPVEPTHEIPAQKILFAEGTSTHTGRPWGKRARDSAVLWAQIRNKFASTISFGL